MSNAAVGLPWRGSLEPAKVTPDAGTFAGLLSLRGVQMTKVTKHLVTARFYNSTIGNFCHPVFGPCGVQKSSNSAQYTTTTITTI